MRSLQATFARLATMAADPTITDAAIQAEADAAIAQFPELLPDLAAAIARPMAMDMAAAAVEGAVEGLADESAKSMHFDPSQPRDEDGKWQSGFFHGTMSEFDTFSADSFNTRSKGEAGSRNAFFFTKTRDSAESYAYDSKTNKNGRVIEAELRFKNPMTLPKSPTAADIVTAKKRGYDAIVTPYEVAVFQPTQIKQVKSHPVVDEVPQ
jgi:hypothetical protein